MVARRDQAAAGDQALARSEGRASGVAQQVGDFRRCSRDADGEESGVEPPGVGDRGVRHPLRRGQDAVRGCLYLIEAERLDGCDLDSDYEAGRWTAAVGWVRAAARSG